MAEYRQLLAILWDYTLPEVDRIQAAEKLYNTGNANLAITFVELLKLDRSPKMRLVIVKALGKVTHASPPDIQVVKILNKISVYDCDSALREEAKISLDLIKQRYESSRGNFGRKRSETSKSYTMASKSPDSIKPDWSILINGELVSDLLKRPG